MGSMNTKSERTGTLPIYWYGQYGTAATIAKGHKHKLPKKFHKILVYQFKQFINATIMVRAAMGAEISRFKGIFRVYDQKGH